MLPFVTKMCISDSNSIVNSNSKTKCTRAHLDSDRFNEH